MISARYVVSVTILLAVALVPMIIHNYFGATDDDGRITRAIATTVADLRSNDTQRRDSWVQETYDSGDWIERRYTSSDGRDVLVFVARSYNLKRLYHHPELGVLHGRDLGRPVLERVHGPPTMSIHVLRANTGTGVAAYALLYDDQFVEHPLVFQLRTALQQIISARRPMTLFLAYDPTLPAAAPLEGSLLLQVLSEVIRSFQSQMVDVTS